MLRTWVVLGCVLAGSSLAGPADARVERLEIVSRDLFAAGMEFGEGGAYEKLRGRAWFALDPEHTANAPIADLKLAPRNNRGLVIFSAEFVVLRPVDAMRGNGVLLYEVNNRGNIGILRQLNGSVTGSNDPATAADAGNGFLFRRGFTLVWHGLPTSPRRPATSGWCWSRRRPPTAAGPSDRQRAERGRALHRAARHRLCAGQ